MISMARANHVQDLQLYVQEWKKKDVNTSLLQDNLGMAVCLAGLIYFYFHFLSSTYSQAELGASGFFFFWMNVTLCNFNKNNGATKAYPLWFTLIFVSIASYEQMRKKNPQLQV